MKNNYLLIHGSFGSPFSNWIPYLRKVIENRNLEVYTPDFPIGVGYQNYENWSNLMKAYVKSNIINENTIIFAHSIAPIFVCKFLVENKIKVKIDKNITNEILKLTNYREFGARKIDKIIKNKLENIILDKIILGRKSVNIKSIEQIINV